MSSTVLILGGSGKVAKRLTTQLVSSKAPHTFTVHSIIRSASQSDALKSLGSTPHIHSIEDTTVASLADKFRQVNPSAIVWSAGAGGGDPSRTERVDRDGAIKAMDAAVEAGVKRFVIVSAYDCRDRENKATPEWYSDADKEKSDGLWNALGSYMKCKLAADRELVDGNGRRGLKYTIVRPGSLTEDEGKGTVQAGRVGLTQSISRDDVAAVIVECLKNDATAGLAFDLVGGDTPIAEAVKKLADERIDCFEGYH